MEKEPKVGAEDPKIDLFEDDDEFEEFVTNAEWEEKEGKEITQQQEDDWDDDDVSDDFSIQLSRELENSMPNSRRAKFCALYDLVMTKGHNTFSLYVLYFKFSIQFSANCSFVKYS